MLVSGKGRERAASGMDDTIRVEYSSYIAMYTCWTASATDAVGRFTGHIYRDTYRMVGQL